MKKAIIDKTTNEKYQVYIFDEDLPFLVIFVDEFSLSEKVIEEFISGLENVVNEALDREEIEKSQEEINE